ncbi:MAG: class I SAM-dependent methyltransferase [Bacteroidota bacterium]
MDRNYWERIAVSYNDEIFDVFQNDKTGIIRSSVKEYASSSKTVMDIGCAVGKWIPFLSTQFKKVVATDISAKNLEFAKQKGAAIKNAQYIRADMSDPKLSIAACDVAVCINAILTGSLQKRVNFFSSLSKCVKKNGALILVVPSLESSMYTSIIRHRWKVDNAANRKKLSVKDYKVKIDNYQQGNIEIDSVPTKHYLQEELTLLLKQEKFKIVSFHKVQYDWKTEFLHPPKWLKEPYPWDWLCIAEKK